MIILDLEWNRGYDKKAVDEILQIGAVRVDRLGGPILDTYNAYIKPVIHKKFDLGAKKLPELRRSLDSELTFAQALEGFRVWCGEDREFAGWGCDDFRTLERNCDFHGLPHFEIGEMRDIQRAYCRAVGSANAQMALWRAVQYCNIPDVFCYHDALNDAMYTASLCAWLTEEDFLWEPPKAEHRRRLRFSELPFVPRPCRKIGPLPGAEAVLDSKDSRRPVCPICGERVWVVEWSSEDGVCYYAPFRCREHGRFLCRLTLVPVGDGSVRGELDVPALTPELLADYERALDGTLHHCKPLRRRRRRPHLRAMEEKGA